MKTFKLLFLICAISSASATTLDQFSPRPVHGFPWSDAWYYYIHDPDVGYFKIVFLTFLNQDTGADKQEAYLHVVFTPKTGQKREYDYYYKDVVAAPVNGDKPYSFKFEVPGAAKINESSIELNLPDVSISAQFKDEHIHYSNDENPGASPFGWVTSLPFVENQWFVFSMATETQYRFKDHWAQHSGHGLTYIDRGWNDGQAAGMIYLMAVSEQVKLMFTGGIDGNLPIESWAGRLITPKHNLTFSPSIKGWDTTTKSDICASWMEVQMIEGDYRVKIVAEAPLGSFYNHVTPSLTVFQSENPVMKSMSAKTSVEVYKNDRLVETVSVDQSILEYGGSHYCDKMHGKGQAADLVKRP
ncbi:hypothetical protein HBA55_21230 [Pseudomaricurvus alkylphenolicus]|uniref:hypothetical protein n=1 Tax=Pseudomaricurvus alkylphenolicus TaxID=1306991 RepID=UPI001421CA88|nr:hypothetical protein [Pseudomaricurvus alkylphenolicus]NIB42143.1 hypothetical protein [Pseudomaricurvus alkylphenolicus]